MTSSKIQWVALIAVAIIALGGWIYPIAQQVAGGVTNYDEIDATAMKIGGANGSRLGPVISTTCNFLGMDTSQAATSTQAYDCAVTGVVSGDNVIGMIASSTGGPVAFTNNFVAIRSCHASTTNGFATCDFFNGTGASQVLSASNTKNVGSSTEILVLHPVTSVPGL